jgi:uncharacterized MAPEG superfamily protein
MGTMLGQVAQANASAPQGMETFPAFMMMAMMANIMGGL